MEITAEVCNVLTSSDALVTSHSLYINVNVDVPYNVKMGFDARMPWQRIGGEVRENSHQSNIGIVPRQSTLTSGFDLGHEWGKLMKAPRCGAES